MKKIISLSTVFVAVMILFSSCGKYEEGPMISLKSKEARVEGTYSMVKAYKNGIEDSDKVEYYANTTFVYNEDGTGETQYREDSFTINNDLEWEFSDDETKLLQREKSIISGNWGEWEEFLIIRLTDTEMWLQEYDILDNQWEYHYKE
ncbi:MAG: hypothetical protein U9N51_09860 [Bacteroidota bacterium]|nr:hypothetical protein [Bacteroidota bacterium]